MLHNIHKDMIITDGGCYAKRKCRSFENGGNSFSGGGGNCCDFVWRSDMGDSVAFSFCVADIFGYAPAIGKAAPKDGCSARTLCGIADNGGGGRDGYGGGFGDRAGVIEEL